MVSAMSAACLAYSPATFPWRSRGRLRVLELVVDHRNEGAAERFPPVPCPRVALRGRGTMAPQRPRSRSLAGRDADAITRHAQRDGASGGIIIGMPGRTRPPHRSPPFSRRGWPGRRARPSPGHVKYAADIPWRTRLCPPPPNPIVSRSVAGESSATRSRALHLRDFLSSGPRT